MFLWAVSFTILYWRCVILDSAFLCYGLAIFAGGLCSFLGLVSLFGLCQSLRGCCKLLRVWVLQGFCKSLREYVFLDFASVAEGCCKCLLNLMSFCGFEQILFLFFRFGRDFASFLWTFEFLCGILRSVAGVWEFPADFQSLCGALRVFFAGVCAFFCFLPSLSWILRVFTGIHEFL